MKIDKSEVIEQYLNGELSLKEMLEVEFLIKTDFAFAQEYYLIEDVNQKLSNQKIRDFYLLLKTFKNQI